MPDRPTPLLNALIARHQAETTVLPDNPPRNVILLHAQRQALELVEFARTLERDRAELIEGLERIAWHELTWKEARDLARALLSRLRGEGRR